jgi:septum formation protein
MNIPANSRLILASASPRRRELLQALGLPFDVMVPHIEENSVAGESPERTALRLARAKALAVAGRIEEGLVLGVDTIVVIDGDILGKPADGQEAQEMLTRLSGRTHMVISAMYLHRVPDGKCAQAVPTTEVTFNTLTPTQIDAYIASGEPLDKAGAYAIQGLGSVIVRSIVGCYFNVVGLSLPVLAQLLREFGWEVL